MPKSNSPADQWLIRIEHKADLTTTSIGPFSTRREATIESRKIHSGVYEVANVWVEEFYPPSRVALAVAQFLAQAYASAV